MPEPFQIAVPDSEVDDLRRRLAQTRWPSEVADSGWQYGSNLAYMRELCEYWRTSFDWRAQEAKLNRMPQFTTQVSADGVEDYTVHFVHQQGVGPNPLPLLFTHGWPGSFYEVSKILGPLTDPGAYGGDPADAFTVVAPSLPGFGCSQIPESGGFGHMRGGSLVGSAHVSARLQPIWSAGRRHWSAGLSADRLRRPRALHWRPNQHAQQSAAGGSP